MVRSVLIFVIATGLPVASCKKVDCGSPRSAASEPSVAGNQMRRIDDPAALQFTISQTIHAGPAPVYLILAIANIGQEDLWINRRLLIGPRGAPDAEVWLDITDIANGKPIQEDACAGKGIPSSTSDYILLPTGATYSLIAPLVCHRFTEAQSWRIVGHYQDRVLKARAPSADVQWFAGTLVSNEIVIDMTGKPAPPPKP